MFSTRLDVFDDCRYCMLVDVNRQRSRKEDLVVVNTTSIMSWKVMRVTVTVIGQHST